MHNKPHTEEAKKKIREKIERWKTTPEYKIWLEKVRKSGKRSKTKFKKGHKPLTDGKNLKGLQAGEKHWNWSGGKIIAFGYRLVWKPDHPFCSSRGYVQEHRLVMEEKIGRYLEKNEVVHHIDKNKLNNDPKNLVLMTKSEHSKLHMKERYEQATQTLASEQCR